MRIAPVPVFTAIFIVLFVFSGCAAMMEKAGRALDGSAFAEKTDAVYANDEAGFSGRGVRVSRKQITARDRDYILIGFDAFPALGIRASVPDRNHRIVLESLAVCCTCGFFAPPITQKSRLSGCAYQRYGVPLVRTQFVG
jgi:hypothetical protein